MYRSKTFLIPNKVKHIIYGSKYQHSLIWSTEVTGCGVAGILTLFLLKHHKNITWFTIYK